MSAASSAAASSALPLIAGLVEVGGLPDYVASKHSVAGLAKATCAEYGAQGIRSNCIAPGYIDTPVSLDSDTITPELVFKRVRVLSRGFLRLTPPASTNTLTPTDDPDGQDIGGPRTPPSVPMQRAGRPEEIAGVAVFLCSEGASLAAEGGRQRNMDERSKQRRQ